MEVLTLVTGDDFIAVHSAPLFNINEIERISTFITSVITKTASRIKSRDYVSKSLFVTLNSYFMKDTNALFSQLGIDYLINFGTSKD